jgi:hypothetical protein
MATEFYYNKCRYTCCIINNPSSQELRIRNERGEVLAVEKGKKIGLQGKKRNNSKQVNVSQPYLYNLIKAAINALELADKERMLLEQEAIIERQNEQVKLLKQELEIFHHNKILSLEQEDKLLHLQNQLKEHEVLVEKQKKKILKLEDAQSQFSQTISLESAEKQVKSRLGISAWNCLHPASQRDLRNAYRYYKMIKTEDTTSADYSDAGHPLGLVAEREIVNPFFKKFYQFLLTKNNFANFIEKAPILLGSINLVADGEYTLGDLRILLSQQWQTFTKFSLQQEKMPNTNLYYTVERSDKISQAERLLVQQFLQQWKHPLSLWLAQSFVAASAIDQIRRLRNIAAHSHSMHLWQFTELWFLLVGGKTRKGVLQEIYHNSATENVCRIVREKSVTFNYCPARSDIYSNCI